MNLFSYCLNEILIHLHQFFSYVFRIITIYFYQSNNYWVNYLLLILINIFFFLLFSGILKYKILLLVIIFLLEYNKNKYTKNL